MEARRDTCPRRWRRAGVVHADAEPGRMSPHGLLRKVQSARMNMAKASGRRSSQRETASSDTSPSVHEGLLEMGSIRLDSAVASSCGTSHAINEDFHSTLDGALPLFAVADGVSAGAMASCASRELV